MSISSAAEHAGCATCYAGSYPSVCTSNTAARRRDPPPRSKIMPAIIHMEVRNDTAVRRAATRAVVRCHRLPASARSPYRVLVFMPIGREHSSIAIDKSKKLVQLPSVSLFLAHYDDSQSLYSRLPWYSRVAYTAVVPRNIKIVLARQLLIQDDHMREVLLSRYSHVWITDDDVAFPAARHLLHFLNVATRLDAAIVQPTTNGSVHTLVRPTLSSPCAVATPTDFVESQNQLMDRCAFIEAVGVLHHSSRSDYGLDMIWCRWFANKPGRWNLCTACAIVRAQGFEKRYGEAHTHSYSTAAASEDDRRLRGQYAPYESLCTVVGACRDIKPTHNGAKSSMSMVTSTHRRRPYRSRTCTAPRPGLVVDGPCGAWRADSLRQRPPTTQN